MRIVFILGCLLFASWKSSQAQDLQAIDTMKFIDAVSNKSIGIRGYSDKPLILLIFTSNYCPYSRKYESRIMELYQSYASRGVQLFLINPNSGESDNLEEMQKKANDLNYKFPYLSDKDQRLTQLLGAERTPQAFLLRRKGYQLLYQGAIDDNPQAPDYVESHYLVEALEQTLSGKQVTPEKVKVIGCMIKKDS